MLRLGSFESRPEESLPGALEFGFLSSGVGGRTTSLLRATCSDAGTARGAIPHTTPPFVLPMSFIFEEKISLTDLLHTDTSPCCPPCFAVAGRCSSPHLLASTGPASILRPVVCSLSSPQAPQQAVWRASRESGIGCGAPETRGCPWYTHTTRHETPRTTKNAKNTPRRGPASALPKVCVWLCVCGIVALSVFHCWWRCLCCVSTYYSNIQTEYWVVSPHCFLYS